jgi:hypothetical protein
MRTARWNWLVLLVFGLGALTIGIIGFLVGAFTPSPAPLTFLVFGGVLIVGSFFTRRAYRRYVADA